MREILFRGKQANNGEWVYGDLLQTANATYKRYQIFPHTPCAKMSTFIAPETVGQCTGLTDKNGTKIFEGDIVKLGTGELRFVFWADVRFKHTMYNDYAREFSYKDKSYEVIGNIHDNPEFLGV